MGSVNAHTLRNISCFLPSSLQKAEYKTMFHGNTHLTPSTYFWWFPVKNITYARMVHQIERWYKGKIKIEYGYAGSAEM